MKAAFLLNGAGAIALLSFWGTGAVRDKLQVAEAIARSLLFMSVGAALVIPALVAAYVAIHLQYVYAKQANERTEAEGTPCGYGWKLAQFFSGIIPIISAGLFAYSAWGLSKELPQALISANEPTFVGQRADENE